ncbi:substrate-binding domain-containing protein [Subtercola sp. Z020]|uniref:substrate-binding domain-containing protein n=1 Tax=Subtercola sp. Z020 TaxID=2080582 RepID=UPI001E2F32A3|nr:substrate-binding domain-containing protein [Subtercola sp. Z020]
MGAHIVSALADALTSHGLQLLWQLGTPSAAMGGDLAPAVVLTSLGEHEAGFAELSAGFRVPVRSLFPGLDGFQASPGGAQVDHLIDRGHRRLAYAASDDPQLERSSTLRQGAVLTRAEERGITTPFVVAMPLERQAARSALAALLSRDHPPTAVCAYNDHVAMAVLAAASDLGLSVPSDVAVIGVDDDPVAQLMTPALSSVRAELGDFVDEFAAEIAAGIVGSDSPEVKLPASPVVVIRGSS